MSITARVRVLSVGRAGRRGSNGRAKHRAAFLTIDFLHFYDYMVSRSLLHMNTPSPSLQAKIDRLNAVHAEMSAGLEPGKGNDPMRVLSEAAPRIQELQKELTPEERGEAKQLFDELGVELDVYEKAMRDIAERRRRLLQLCAEDHVTGNWSLHVTPR